MFRKLQEMSRVRPVALQPKQRRARLDSHKGKKFNVIYVVIISIFLLVCIYYAAYYDDACKF